MWLVSSRLTIFCFTDLDLSDALYAYLRVSLLPLLVLVLVIRSFVESVIPSSPPIMVNFVYLEKPSCLSLSRALDSS